MSAAELNDATGRAVQIPDHSREFLPAGPPAAVLLVALAPDLMIGWPHAPSSAAHAWLPNGAVALPSVPMLTGRQDVTDQIASLHPDLILDFSTVSPRYVQLGEAVQTKTGFLQCLMTALCSRRRKCCAHLALRCTGRIARNC